MAETTPQDYQRVKEVLEAAKETVNYNGEILEVSRFHLWRYDDTPIHSGDSGSPGTNVEPNPANLYLTVRRKSGSFAELELVLRTHIVAVHVIQTSKTQALYAEIENHHPPASAHYTWTPSSTGAVVGIAEREPELGPFQTLITRDISTVDFCATRGPRWPGPDIAIRVGDSVTWRHVPVEYIVVVEFEGGVSLKAGPQELEAL